MLLHEYIARSLPNDAYLANLYGDEYIDDRLCEYVYRSMKEKLALARDKGRGGWYREDCKIDDLKKMLIEHIDKGDMIDVINFAAMIYAKKLMAEMQ